LASPAAAGGDDRDWAEHQADSRKSVPEIDPGTAGSALSLVLGGIAMFADRRRNR